MAVLCCVLSILLTLSQATTPGGSPAAGGPSSQPALPRASADVMTPEDPKERMELAEKVNGLKGMDVPWHLKASYEVFGIDGKSTDAGTYEEWRVDAKHYRLALHSPSVSAEEYGADNGVFAAGKERWPGRPLSSIKEMIARPIPPEADSEKMVLQNYERSFGANKLPCTALMKRGANIKAEDAKSFCFSSTNAVLLYASTPNKLYQTLFEHIASVHGHYFARDMQLFIEGRPWLKVHIDTVEGLDPAGVSALTVPADASPVTVRTDATGDVIAGHLIKKAYPAYPETAKLQGVQGTVILDGIIGTDGHFKKLQVLAGPPMLQKAALDAAEQWVYTPYLVDGQPVEVETDINVVFSLSR